MLLEAERAANFDGDMTKQRAVRDIVWKDNQCVRLFLHCCASDLAHNTTSDSLRVARAMHERLGDEKGPEDMHQHIRDVQRQRRHKFVCGRTIFAACLTSNILEERKLPRASVPVSSLCQQAWRSRKFNLKSKQTFAACPKDFPKDLNGLLDPRVSYPAATVESQVQSFLAWSWLLQAASKAPPEIPGGAWASRLVPQHWIIRVRASKTAFINLYSGRHGCIVLEVCSTSESTFCVIGQTGLVQPLHIDNPVEFELVQIAPQFSMDDGIFQDVCRSFKYI